VCAVSTGIQPMQKALTQMNFQLANGIRDLSGWTGQRIVRAILAGERDPAQLATLSHPGIHASRHTIAKSLEGTWRYSARHSAVWLSCWPGSVSTA
jgi:transposase